jgi:MoaA/NifB/PqqE/SkfB family radical SAM enzyme
MSKKSLIKKAVVNKIIGGLSHLSNKQIIKLTAAVEKIAPKSVRGHVKATREFFEKNILGFNFSKQLFTNMNKNCRKKFIGNLIMDGLIDNFDKRVQAEKDGHAPIFTVLISPSMRCNLRCVGCYAMDYKMTDDLPFEDLDRVVDEAKEMGVAFITILGGEPFIRKDIFDLFKKHSDTYFQVYSNGILVDEEVVKKLAKLGNVLLNFSLEGFEENTDARRNKGTYQGVMKAMDLMKKYGVPFGFSVCVTPKNYKEVTSDEFLDTLIAKGIIIGWYFMYMPVCGDTDIKLMITPKQRLYIKERREEIRKTKPMFLVDFWNDAPFVGGCIAGRQYAHITNKGDVEPCIFTHYSQANIKDMSLREALDKPFYKELRDRQPHSENLYLPCMLVDHPEVFRELRDKYDDLKPTHPKADTMVTTLVDEIDEYSKEVKEIYGPVWEKDKDSFSKIISADKREESEESK